MGKEEKNKKIIIFEAFSGIGSQHQALKNIGYNVEIAGISDWFIDAIIAYSVNHLKMKAKKINKKIVVDFLSNYSFSFNSKTPAKNISKLSEDKLSILKQAIDRFGNLDIKYISGKDIFHKNIDLFTYSFPCQDISQQGKQKGFSKKTDSRSGLLWQIERILKEISNEDKSKLPKILMMENVKAILNDSFKEDLNNWIAELKKLGYKSTKPFVINSANLGEAQRRERVFMLSYIGDKKIKDFEILNKYKDNFIGNIFEKNMEHELFKTKKNIKIVHKEHKIGIKKSFLDGYSNFNAESYVYFKDGKSPTITASGAQSRIKVFHNDNIVYLNGFEHLKLQGFKNKNFYNNLKKYGMNEARIKFLAGNSINIKVLEEIFSFYL